MVGYPEALTDPSYFGQILVLTYPLIGNYGVPQSKMIQDLLSNYEANRAMISGLIVEDYSNEYTHWNAASSLAQWLYNNRVPALSGIDTRALTRRIREKGVMLGKLEMAEQPVEFFDPNTENLARQVCIDKSVLYGKSRKRILLSDCGCKHSIIRELLSRNVEVLRVPWDYPLQGEKFDGLLISSGPGDPKMCPDTIREVGRLINAGDPRPVMGICLGHQIMALAIGADTYKMKYGHRSQNQPVINCRNQKAVITSQNHGFAVQTSTLPKDWQPLFANLNDDTSEGMIHQSGRYFSVQFHPEASPGPVDTSNLFDQFIDMV